MEKYSLKWDDFETNIKESFRNLRNEQRLFDVTLVTDDGQHIQAHRLILSAGSDLFCNIFKKSYDSNMVVYLKGISSPELELVTDFLYNGEAFVTQDKVKHLIETAQELKIKGLHGDLHDVIDSLNSNKSNVGYIEKKTENDQDVIKKESNLDTFEVVDNSLCDIKDKSLIAIDNKNLVLKENVELDLQVEKITEKKEGFWECKVCGKTSAYKNNIQNHAETHIHGHSHVCNICDKTMATSESLRKHISGVHSDLFICDVCGKTGMSKEGYRSHKRKNHKSINQ